jgi:acyl homoserine lactone synthase
MVMAHVDMIEGTREELRSELKSGLASYRYQVFVESLGWSLPCEIGVEWDQFDRLNTIYVIAKEAGGEICGCARLLPTTGSYLLSEVFPYLLGDMPPPRDPQIWELSRFSTRVVDRRRTKSAQDARSRFRDIFAAVVLAATKRGARRLITFTTIGVERILRSIGIHAHRIGAPHLVDDEPVLVLWIELDEATHAALNIPAQREQVDIH